MNAALQTCSAGSISGLRTLPRCRAKKEGRESGTPQRSGRNRQEVRCFSQGTNRYGRRYAAPDSGAPAAEAFGMSREAIDKSIKFAWIAAVASAVLTAVAWAVAMAGVPELAGFHYGWIDLFILAPWHSECSAGAGPSRSRTSLHSPQEP